MSQKFPGGIISKTAPVPTGPYENGTAPGVWTLEQQAEFVKQGIWPIAGNVPNYIEDVFQTWLYTGNGSTQTITNGIDLAGEGGLVWIKSRAVAGNHYLMDTARGFNTGVSPAVARSLSSDRTTAQDDSSELTAFNSNGFTLGSSWVMNDDGSVSGGSTYASWTFRKQPKFFDVVTYTGDGADISVNHALDSVPGCIIIKRTDSTSDWWVYHRGLTNDGANYSIKLNTTAAQVNTGGLVATSTTFTLYDNANVNISGATYVAYLFAHNAGGFGLTGTDNVISCGSFTQASGGTTVTLGYEPQWVLVKNSSGTGNWFIFDNMRGNTNTLIPNLSNAEGDQGAGSFQYNATGFTMADYITGSVGSTLIYIAIRRGPMKVPTTGTSVFAPVAYTGNGGTQIATTGFPVDAMIEFERTNSSGVPAAGGKYMTDRLRGSSAYLETSSTAAESTGFVFGLANNTGVTLSTYFNSSPRTYIIEAFQRAPGFFDEVCYTGTGSAMTVPHNLAAVPELMIVKSRSTSDSWPVYSAATGNTLNLFLNQTNAADTPRIYWNNTTPTASVFSLGDSGVVSNSGGTFVSYLFASCPGVSKVGSYTGTGALQTVNCGFTTGARFVLIKRTDSTGDWWVYDSARGITSGDDPYLFLNSTAAEVTGTNYVDTTGVGFQVTAAAPAGLNASGGTYIFLAIA